MVGHLEGGMCWPWPSVMFRFSCGSLLRNHIEMCESNLYSKTVAVLITLATRGKDGVEEGENRVKIGNGRRTKRVEMATGTNSLGFAITNSYPSKNFYTH